MKGKRVAYLLGQISNVQSIQPLIGLTGVSYVFEFLRRITASNFHEDSTSAGVFFQILGYVVDLVVDNHPDIVWLVMLLDLG